MPDMAQLPLSSKRRKVDSNEVTPKSSRIPQIFSPFRTLGVVSNHVPPSIQVREKAYLVTTSVGKAFQTWDTARMNLLFVGGDTKDPISAIESAGNYVFVAAGNQALGFRRGKQELRMPEVSGRITKLLHLSSMLLAITASPPQLHIFNIFEEDLVGSLDLGEGGDVTAILHPATWLNKVLLGRENGVVQIWNIRTGNQIFETESFGSAVAALSQSPALDIIGIGLQSGTIHVRNLRTNTEVLTFSQPDPVYALSFSTDGQPLLGSSSRSGQISIFNLNKRRVAHTFDASPSSQAVYLQFLPGQPVLLTTSKDNSIKLFMFEESGPRVFKSRQGHSSPPTRLFAHSERFILSTGDGTLRAQSLYKDSQSFELSQGVLMDRSRKQAAGQGFDGGKIGDVVSIGSTRTREDEWDSILTASRGENGARTWSWGGKRLGSHILRTGDNTQATAVFVSYCGNFGVVGSEKGNVEVFNMQSGMKRNRYLKGHSQRVTFVGLDKLNKTLISAGRDGLVLLWDFKTAKIKGKIDVGTAITVGKMQGGLLAFASDDLCIRVVDFETPGGRVVRELWGHSNRITDFVFSPSSSWVISVSLDSTLRTWDLPTGFLISAVKLPSIATAIAFSPAEEFLATTHVGSLAIHLWSNRSQFRNIPIRRVKEEDIPTLEEALPSISGVSGRGGEGILDGAFDGDENEADEDISGVSTIDQLSEELLTLSLQPRSKMWSLLNLEAIRRRNKAKEPVKQPEKAPFFLPSIQDSTKTREGVQVDTHVETQDAPRSRILRLQDGRVESEFTRLLNSAESEEFIRHLMTLSPSQLDYSLRLMDIMAPYAEPLNFIRALTFHLKSKRDFELVQAWMLAFLRIQQDWLIEARDVDEIREAVKDWEELHKAERERIGNAIGYVGGVLGFIRGI